MAAQFSMAKANVQAFDNHGDPLGTWDGVSIACRNGLLTLRAYRSTTIVGGPYQDVERAEVTGRTSWRVHLADGTYFDVQKVKCNCGGGAR